MEIPDLVVAIFVAFIVIITAFTVWNVRRGKAELIHRLYYILSMIMVAWAVLIVVLHFTDSNNAAVVYVLNNLTYIGTFIPVMALLIVIVFTQNIKRLPAVAYLLLAVPALSNILVWTNPFHHLYFKTLSLDITQVEFGPYFIISSGYTVLCSVVAIVLLAGFAIKNRSRLAIKQVILFSLGIAVPLVVNILATVNVINIGYIATPLSFIVTIILQGVAIYRYHFFDIRPIAMQSVLDWINDGYLVVGKDGIVISYNNHFYHEFGSRYGIVETVYLKDRLRHDDIENKTGLYNLVTAIESARLAKAHISYEQSVYATDGLEMKKNYYIVEVTPLLINTHIEGFVVYLKDVTTVKESMERLQIGQARMMEQERLASLGQLVAGLAHNLKTPIMSISGSAVAMENLIEECELSMGDPEITNEDYKEIYGEMYDWIVRLREACTYMSDIISAVKGQAKNIEASDYGEFTLDQLMRMVALLLRHELLTGECDLVVENKVEEEFWFTGDINNLVQVVNNLVSNAIHAVQEGDNKTIVVGAEKDERGLNLYVKDIGPGIPDEIKEKLFKQMTTSKGTAGTGLGVYISNAIIRAKFDGKMWVCDNPEGGTVFWIAIPRERIIFADGGEKRNV